MPLMNASWRSRIWQPAVYELEFLLARAFRNPLNLAIDLKSYRRSYQGLRLKVYIP